MQIKDLFEQTPAPIQPSSTDTADVGKLTATVSSLQKQVSDLQKAALQQTSQSQQAQQQTKPGEAGQAQQITGTQGTTTAPAQKPAQAGGMLDMIKKLAGIQPQQKPGQPMGQAPTQQTQAPGVNQTPQMTALKIKQDLARTQGKST
jgi:hypothetical protein